MTRSLHIANTSNHDNEDYQIERVSGGDTAIPEDAQTLVPGRYIYMYPGEHDGMEAQYLITVVARDGKSPEAFANAQGSQTLPEVEVTWSDGAPAGMDAYDPTLWDLERRLRRLIAMTEDFQASGKASAESTLAMNRMQEARAWLVEARGQRRRT